MHRKLPPLTLHRMYEDDIRYIWDGFRTTEFSAAQISEGVPYRNIRKIISRGYVIKTKTVTESGQRHNVYRVSDRMKACCMERFDDI